MGKVLFLLVFGLCGGAVWAETPLDIHYGANEVDINGDGVKDLIVRYRWDNMNAHSFDRYLVTLRLKSEYGFEEPVPYDVPLGKRGYDHSIMMAAEGMDCVTADDRALHNGFTFALDKKGRLVVRMYDRIWKKPADKYPVEVTTYRLTEGGVDERVDEEIGILPGDPVWYLKEVGKRRLVRWACDVREVMPK